MPMPKEEIVRRLFTARARGDFEAVRSLFTEDAVWHEPGDADYSGDHRGRDTIIALMQALSAATEGTFVLEPQEFLTTEEHAVARVRWRAERRGRSVEGNELAVYRFFGDRIAEVWFFYDGFDADAHDAVFTLEAG